MTNQRIDAAFNEMNDAMSFASLIEAIIDATMIVALALTIIIAACGNPYHMQCAEMQPVAAIVSMDRFSATVELSSGQRSVVSPITSLKPGDMHCTKYTR